jgi:SnoaL-like domain
VDTIEDLMTSNLLRVFNERDDARRTEAIARTYTADVTWTDDEGVITGHTALQAKAKELLSGIPGFVFSPAGPVYQTLGLGYLAWNLGPDGAAPVVSGFDVAIVRDGPIAELYMVITKAPQS